MADDSISDNKTNTNITITTTETKDAHHRTATAAGTDLGRTVDVVVAGHHTAAAAAEGHIAVGTAAGIAPAVAAAVAVFLAVAVAASLAGLQWLAGCTERWCAVRTGLSLRDENSKQL